MKRFVQLTDDHGKPLYVDPAAVTSIWQSLDPKLCLVHTGGEKWIVVKGSAPEIAGLIEQAGEVKP